MKAQIDRLRRKVRDLAYQVESYGDLGATRELEALRNELREACIKARPVVSRKPSLFLAA
jgi:hypothetical protein